MIFAALIVVAAGSTAASGAVTLAPGATIQGLHPVALASAPTGSKVLVCLEDGSVRIMDAGTHQTVKTLARHPQPCYAAAWSKDGLYVATGDESARIFIESPLSGAMIRQYRTHTKGIQKLSFNVTRRFLISTGKDDQINIYDLSSASTREARKILGKGDNFYGATYSTAVPYTFSTGILGPGGRCYDCNTCKTTGFLVTKDHEGVFDVAYNPAGSRIVLAGKNGDANVFDATTFRKLGELKGHQDFVMFAAYSPNGAFIATSSTDRSVKVWNAYSFQKVAELTGQCTVGSPLCFTADGSTLVTVNDADNLVFTKLTPTQAAVDAPAKAPARAKKRRKHHSV